MLTRVTTWTCLLALLLGQPAWTAEEPDPVKLDEAQLLELNLSSDGPALVEFLRQQVRPIKDPQRLGKLIKELGDDNFRVRIQATEALVGIGPPALPALREALNEPDVEVVRRAESCIAAIEKLTTPTLTAAVVRLLAVRRPEQAAATLLEYLPRVEDPLLVNEIARALARVGVQDGKADPLLLRALADRSPRTRGVVAEALGRGAPGNRTEVRKLAAEDPDPGVRLRAALGLVAGRDRAGVVALLRLLPDVPAEHAWEIEVVLERLAGDKGPVVVPGDTPAARKKAQEAWQAWWMQHGAAVDLARADPDHQMHGFLLVASMPIRGGISGKVAELDPAGKTRWEIDNLRYPVCAQVLPGNKVLIGEYSNRAVTERDFTGKVVWQKQVNNLLVAAQRLPNGNTLIATRNSIIETTPQGKDVLTLNRPSDIVSAKKLPNGDLAVLTTTGNFLRLDATGKQLASVPTGGITSTIGTQFDVLPNGRVIVPRYATNQVAEIDPTGKMIWQAPFQQPTSVSRLPNGNILVASRYHGRVVELSPAGKEVRTYNVDGRVLFATKR
jgi:HEAT repeat protein